MAESSYLRYPHVARDHIAFTAEDDVWLASPSEAAGGRGTRPWRMRSRRSIQTSPHQVARILDTGSMAAGPRMLARRLSGLALAALVAAGCATGCATAQPQAGAPRHSPAAATPALTMTSSPSPSPSPSVIAIPPPPAGLPQTQALPSANTQVFNNEMTDLWTAIVTGNTSVAIQSFFPLSAYQQVKAISDPTADWNSRLVGDYVLDIQAAHSYLGVNAANAQFVQVIVPSQYAAWINPGGCYNKVGYWHVPGSRLVYRVNGQLRSIGIASLISWRGQWYVVHLGAVIRNSTAGIVDDPSIGTGMTGPPGGC